MNRVDGEDGPGGPHAVRGPPRSWWRSSVKESDRRRYELEREWARQIRAADRERRHRLYAEVYERYYRDLSPPASAASESARRRDLDLQAQLLEPYLTPDTVLVEAGGGDGGLARRLATKVERILLVEATVAAIDEGSLPPNVELHLSPQLELALADGSADLVYSCHFLEHLHPEDARHYLDEMHRLLRVGGKLLCVTPNRLWGPHDASRHFGHVATALHMREYDTTELAGLLRDHGFDDLRAVSAPGAAASRAALERCRSIERRLAPLPPTLRRLLLSLTLRRRPLRRLEQVVIVGAKTSAGGRPASARASDRPEVTVEPFLHVEKDRLYNPLTGRSLEPGSPLYRPLLDHLASRQTTDRLPATERQALLRSGWLVPAGSGDARRFRLRYVSLEGSSVCNQACSFCPVSIAPRAPEVMGMELFEQICDQLTEFRDTLDAVFLHNYNEPTADPWFVERVRALVARGLPAACNTNASGLTPQRTDALVELGGLGFLSINLSTVDRGRYRSERGVDQLEQVLRHLDYAARRPLAERMEVAVLGHGDRLHRRELLAVRRRLAGSRFVVKPFRIHDRAGALPAGLQRTPAVSSLRGCSDLGSRPLQHLHVTANGRCVLCCQDYYEHHPVGDLREQTVQEVLAGPELARLRRWVYGLEPAPEDFLCRRCVFARSEGGREPAPV